MEKIAKRMMALQTEPAGDDGSWTRELVVVTFVRTSNHLFAAMRYSPRIIEITALALSTARQTRDGIWAIAIGTTTDMRKLNPYVNLYRPEK